jgi:prepilin-type N-terminal cleavage/methylation domain-containing protein
MPTRTPQQGAPGFTLVELLVAAAILGVLMALLLPAVQSSRESARAASCKNHLRQLAIALANHEAAHREYPIGAASAPYRTMGVSWIVATLPYLEEGTLFDAYDRRSLHSGEVGLHVANRRVVAGQSLPVLRCPASPLPAMDAYGVSQFMLPVPCYVGVAGAAINDGERRVAKCCLPQPNGLIGAGGMLPPGRAVSARELTDGASRTLLVAEQSDYVYSAAGYPHRIDGGLYQGWVAGTASPGVPPAYGGTSPAYNITTVRYALNRREYELPGVLDNRGPNNPLVSPHPGVVQAALVDGSVRAIADTISVAELGRLATRDDAGAPALP